MSDAILALLIITSCLTFLYAIVRSFQRFELTKLEKISDGKSGDSLTTSELNEMIEEVVASAVVEANESVRLDLESLANRVDQLQTPGETMLLEDQDGAGDEEKTLGRPLRQRQR